MGLGSVSGKHFLSNTFKIYFFSLPAFLHQLNGGFRSFILHNIVDRLVEDPLKFFDHLSITKFQTCFLSSNFTILPSYVFNISDAILLLI